MQRSVYIHLPKAQTLDIEFKDICYDVHTGFRLPKKPILKKVSGYFKSGELTAIMGPSGAGKSSLLNILTGFQKNIASGNVSYKGSVGNHHWNEYKKESCYIQQDDLLYPLFTVEETMIMAANFKLGTSLNKKAKLMLIDDILDTLDLSKTKETRCDKLSGGQRKRLSIALELIDNPPVMFLDEPTTGLDSLSSHQVIETLHGLARSGRTIICTIHQPSAAIYELFDLVYLVADGQCVYQGSAKNTVGFFSSLGLHCPKYHNPADYMIEVVSKEYGDFNDRIAAAVDTLTWRSNETTKMVANGTYSNSPQNGLQKTTVLINAPSELTKLSILMSRSVMHLWRDWTMVHLKLALHLFVSFTLGLLYGNVGNDGSRAIHNVGFVLVTIVYLCYTSMMPAVLRFPSELPVLRKELFNNWYKLRTYYVAFLVVNAPVQILFALAYTSVAYFLSYQIPELSRFLMFLNITILVSLIAESIGYVLGTTMNTINGTFFGACITCGMLAFAGFLVLFNDLPRSMYYVTYLSYLRYAMEALVQTLYGYGRSKLFCPEETLYCHYKIPRTLLTELAMEEPTYWMDVGILTVNLVILRVIAYFTLRKKLASP